MVNVAYKSATVRERSLLHLFMWLGVLLGSVRICDLENNT